MTGKTDRIPLAGMRGIIEKAMDGLDLTHSCEWTDGGPVEVLTPEPHQVTAGILTAALPEPGNDGNLDMAEAASSILSVIADRLVPFPYTLRAHSLVKRLTEESEAWEQATGLTDTGVPEDAGSVLRCQVCSAELPAGCKRSRRTCSDRCRQKLRRMRALASRQSPAAVRA